MRVRIKDQISI